MLAYVFWHWKRPEVPAAEYETRLQAFHSALSDAPPPNYHGSQALAISQAPWANRGGEAYEDWYFVDGFADLDTLNDAAISASRQVPHDAAAALAAGGTAGIYKLRLGQPVAEPMVMIWTIKPAGMSYPEFLGAWSEPIAHLQGALWMRQMTLGPATEFCIQIGAQPTEPGEASPTIGLDPGVKGVTVALSPRRVFPPGA